jgi:hypothetical protein
MGRINITVDLVKNNYPIKWADAVKYFTSKKLTLKDVENAEWRFHWGEMIDNSKEPATKEEYINWRKSKIGKYISIETNIGRKQWHSSIEIETDGWPIVFDEMLED